ncbi:hypothetical protein THAOC_25956, partial [Thalassiosira oceanica]
VLKALLVLIQDLLSASPLGDVFMPISSCEVCQFWPFPLSSAFATYRTRLRSRDRVPKHESKAREIGRVEETEIMGSGVEDRRTIELDLKCSSDHDGATPGARN